MSVVTSSSEEVYGEFFFGTSLPLLGPLPRSPMRPSMSGGWSEVGLWREGSRRGSIAPGTEGTPEGPSSSILPNAFRAWWATAPPFRGGRVNRRSTRAGVSPGVRTRGGRPCDDVCVWGEKGCKSNNITISDLYRGNDVAM